VTLRTYVDGYYLDTLDETAVFNVAERIPLAVTHFTATPRYPWNGKVDIDLTFTGENREYVVTLVAKDLVGGTNLPVKTATVDAMIPVASTGEVTLRPGTYRLIWDADADIVADADFERVSVSVKVEEG